MKLQVLFYVLFLLIYIKIVEEGEFVYLENVLVCQVLGIILDDGVNIIEYIRYFCFDRIYV